MRVFVCVNHANYFALIIREHKEYFYIDNKKSTRQLDGKYETNGNILPISYSLMDKNVHLYNHKNLSASFTFVEIGAFLSSCSRIHVVNGWKAFSKEHVFDIFVNKPRDDGKSHQPIDLSISGNDGQYSHISYKNSLFLREKSMTSVSLMHYHYDTYFLVAHSNERYWIKRIKNKIH